MLKLMATSELQPDTLALRYLRDDGNDEEA